MKLNNFSVRIAGGREAHSGYVVMRHGQKYSIYLRNDWHVQADATVEVDGKPIGTFRLEPKSTMTLERPPEEEGRFTFYKARTKEFKQIGGKVDEKCGLIRVTFVPEIEAVTTTWLYPFPPFRYEPGVADWTYQPTNTCSSEPPRSMLRSASCCAFTAGATGLSGHSDQQFEDVGAINRDTSKTTVINLRLVADDDPEQPRPLIGLCTPVPPMVY